MKADELSGKTAMLPNTFFEIFKENAANRADPFLHIDEVEPDAEDQKAGIRRYVMYFVRQLAESSESNMQLDDDNNEQVFLGFSTKNTKGDSVKLPKMFDSDRRAETMAQKEGILKIQKEYIQSWVKQERTSSNESANSDQSNQSKNKKVASEKASA